MYVLRQFVQNYAILPYQGNGMGKTCHVPLRNRAKILTEDRAIKRPNSTVLTCLQSLNGADE